MVECWQSYQPHQKSCQPPHRQLHARNARYSISFRCTKWLIYDQKLSAPHAPRGTTHHDSKLMLLGLVSDNVGEVFKVLANDIVDLFVEVTISSIYHISRSQTLVNSLALLTKSLRNRTCESNHLVASFLLNLQNTVDVKVRFFTDQSHIFLRDFSQFSPCFISQDLHLKPSTVFIFFSPNIRHLWARVTFDHVFIFLSFDQIHISYH